MSGKIESLTAAQEARFSEFVEKWTQIGLSTEPADRSRAEAAIREMYKQAGLAAPKTIVWCGSPRALALRSDKKLLSSMGDCVTNAVRDNPMRTVRIRVGDALAESARKVVSANVPAKIRQQCHSAGTTIVGCLLESLRDSVLYAGDPWLSAQDDAARLAAFRYDYEVLGLTVQTECLSGLWELAQSAGWAVPHQNICWVSERYNVLKRDESGLLHSLSGPACAYPDGWAIYVIHGVRVPAFVVERPDEITVEKIDKEDDAEIRSVMVERYRVGEEINGLEAFLRDSGGRRPRWSGPVPAMWSAADPQPTTIKIERLTPEQEARFPEFVEKWTKVATSTIPADRPLAEAAINEMYKQAGGAPPRKIVWCGSPLSMLLTRAIVRDAAFSEEKWVKNVGDQIFFVSWGFQSYRKLGANLADGIWDSVRANVSDRIPGRAITESVQDRIDDVIANGGIASMKSSVKSSVWASIGESIADNIEDVIEDNDGSGILGDSMSEYGQHGASMLALYDYFSEVCGLRSETEVSSGQWNLAQSAGWALAHEHICWVSERHHILRCDETGRLHSLTGPACAYPDGFAIYAIHGVRLPEFVVERPREITVGKIDAETNAEIRRVMIDRYCLGEETNGAAAFMRDGGGQRVDYDEKFGTLWRRELPDDEPIVLLEVTNATPEPDGRFKHYMLRVPPTMTTAREAAAWTFNQSPDNYAPIIET
jgi:hypothetical protein